MKLELVADFMYRKCSKTPEPRPIKELEEVLRKNKLPRDATTWDVPKINRLILKGIALVSIKWEDFLAMLEFNSKDRDVLKVSEQALSALNACSNQSTQAWGLLDIIENTKRIRDPHPVTKDQQKPTSKGPLSSGGMTSMATSLPEPNPSLLAFTSPLGSNSGTAHSRSTGKARRSSGGYESSPNLPVGTGPGTFAGSSMKYHSAGAEQFFSDPAFQRSENPEPRSTTWGPSPLPMDHIGQERSNPQLQYPDTSYQAWQMPTANKRPATEELEGREAHGRELRTRNDRRATQAESVANNIAKADDDETKARRREERAEATRQYEQVRPALKQAERYESSKERHDKWFAKCKEEQDEREAETGRKMAARLAAYKPYRDDRGER